MNYLILFCTWWAQSVRVSQMFLLLFWGGAFTDLGSLLPCMPSTTFSWVFERDPLCISKVLSLWGSVNSNILTYWPANSWLPWSLSRLSSVSLTQEAYQPLPEFVCSPWLKTSRSSPSSKMVHLWGPFNLFPVSQESLPFIVWSPVI